MTTLGIKHEKILRIINEVYNLRISSASLSDAVLLEFHVNSKELRDMFLKPVVELLLKDIEDFSLKE